MAASVASLQADAQAVAGVVSGGVVPDLRRLTKEKHEIWDAIVLDGMLRDIGMPAFGPILSKEDSDAVHAFVIERSRNAYAAQIAAKK